MVNYFILFAFCLESRGILKFYEWMRLKQSILKSILGQTPTHFTDSFACYDKLFKNCIYKTIMILMIRKDHITQTDIPVLLDGSLCMKLMNNTNR